MFVFSGSRVRILLPSPDISKSLSLGFRLSAAAIVLLQRVCATLSAAHLNPVFASFCSELRIKFRVKSDTGKSLFLVRHSSASQI